MHASGFTRVIFDVSIKHGSQILFVFIHSLHLLYIRSPVYTFHVDGNYKSHKCTYIVITVMHQQYLQFTKVINVKIFLKKLSTSKIFFVLTLTRKISQKPRTFLHFTYKIIYSYAYVQLQAEFITK